MSKQDIDLGVIRIRVQAKTKHRIKVEEQICGDQQPILEGCHTFNQNSYIEDMNTG